MADLTHHFEKLSLLIFLGSTMLAMGLTLTPRGIVAPLRNLALVLPALRLNFVVAPVLAWLLTVLIPLDRGYATGLLLLGCAAGAPFLPQVVEFAHGDVTLAAPLIALLTLGTILFMPFGLPLLVPGLRADPRAIAQPLVLLIILPLCVGMLVKSRAAPFAARAAPVLGILGKASMLLFFALLIALNVRLLLGVVGSGAILVALLYFTGLFIIGWLFCGSKPEVRGVMGLATAGRNFGAALVPAAGGFDDPKVTVMIVVGAIVCIIVSFIAAGLIRRKRSHLMSGNFPPGPAAGSASRCAL
jgi:predicted Na+-dependent transporter